MPVHLTCEVCGAGFQVDPYRVGLARACSKPCSSRLGSAARTAAGFGSDFHAQLVERDGCLVWPHSTNRKGYGQLTWHGKRWTTHRLAWHLAYGDVPRLVRHSCDNPPCCHLDHLLGGTEAMNSADMVARDRSKYGERHWNHRLTEDEVIALRVDRAAGASYTTLATTYGVHRSTVADVVTGRTWGHLLDHAGVVSRSAGG